MRRTIAFLAFAVFACGTKADSTAPPPTDAVDVQLAVGIPSKIDLLFLIDNSASMADKEEILAQAVPDLVRRLVDPVCVDPVTRRQVGARQADGSCAVGEPEFPPIEDIHVAMITSSLGGHGAYGVCNDPDPQRERSHNDDHGHLVARDSMDMTVSTFQSEGFLNWNPASVPGQTPASVIDPFSTMVRGIGEHGCGYEAPLEAIYRFLVDPEPYQSVVVQESSAGFTGVAALQGTDSELLKQRSDFLRPDSLVAVVMITDEDDCSIVEVGQGFYSIEPSVSGTSLLGHGTSVCRTNPNDPCCRNCGGPTPPGCADAQNDPECQAGPWTRAADPENLRCWHQKERYGVDFLYPVSRYTAGLTAVTVPDRSGKLVRNPLYDDLSAGCSKTTREGCAAGRSKDFVLLAGIVGVPWQDIAVDPNDASKGFLNARQLTDTNTWKKIVGDPSASPPALPNDPHMIAAVEPRSGLSGPASAPNQDPIHGHEWDPSKAITPNADLQYACTFAVPTPRTCTTLTDCDCFVPDGADPSATKNPLCQDAAGAYSNVQTRAKAYPGTRELQVLQGIGDQGVVSSICPSNLTDPLASDFGYRPAIATLVHRMGPALSGHLCLSRPLPLAPGGLADCRLIEAYNPEPGASCNCSDRAGRVAADASLVTADILQRGSCLCEIKQLEDAATADICRTVSVLPDGMPSGWCYVDPAAQGDTAACKFVESCAASEQRKVRFMSPDSAPRPGAAAFLHCSSAPVTSPASNCP
jgi:hypothetical protein